MTQPDSPSLTTQQLEADLELCERATLGPWEDDGDGSIECAPGFFVCHVTPHANVNTITRTGQTYSHVDALMIARSREGWPLAIRTALAERQRADALEAEVSRLSEIIRQGVEETIAKAPCRIIADGIEIEHWAAKALAVSFIDTLGDAPNYLEMTFHDGEGRSVVVTVQRPDGRTPHQCRKDAEAEVEQQRSRADALEMAIRKHRDQRGDDRCWLDDEELYRCLPEGHEPPVRDSKVELALCEKYIACRHNPATEYVSPQRRIEELEAELATRADSSTLALLAILALCSRDGSPASATLALVASIASRALDCHAC